MKTKQEFLLYIAGIRTEIQASGNENSLGADAFLEAMSSWLTSAKEKPPEEFDWEYASKLIWAGAFYDQPPA